MFSPLNLSWSIGHEKSGLAKNFDFTLMSLIRGGLVIFLSLNIFGIIYFLSVLNSHGQFYYHEQRARILCDLSDNELRALIWSHRAYSGTGVDGSIASTAELLDRGNIQL